MKTFVTAEIGFKQNKTTNVTLDCALHVLASFVQCSAPGELCSILNTTLPERHWLQGQESRGLHLCSAEVHVWGGIEERRNVCRSQLLYTLKWLWNYYPHKVTEYTTSKSTVYDDPWSSKQTHREPKQSYLLLILCFFGRPGISSSNSLSPFPQPNALMVSRKATRRILS